MLIKIKINAIFTAALLFLAVFVPKQANAYTQVTNDPNYAIKTYSAAVQFSPPGATATDVLVLSGSATKVVRVIKVEITADATAVGVQDIFVYKRTVLDAAGTSTYVTPIQHDSAYPLTPTISNTGFIIGQSYTIKSASTGCTNMGSGSNTITTSFVASAVTPSSGTCIALQSATASLKTYTTNPTTLGIGLLIIADHYALPAAETTGYPGVPWYMDFSDGIGQKITLRGVNESIAINLGGGAVPTGLNLWASVTWAEE
jgi:hypothetical protein